MAMEPQVSDTEQFLEIEFLAPRSLESSKEVAVTLADAQADTDSTPESILPITNASIHQGSWKPPDIQQAYLASSILVDEGKGLPIQPPPDEEDRLGLEEQDNEQLPNEAGLPFNNLDSTSAPAPIKEIITSVLPSTGRVGSSSLLPAETLPSNQTDQKAAAVKVLITEVSDAKSDTSINLITSVDKEQILPLGILFPGSPDQLPAPTLLPLLPLFISEEDIIDFNTITPGSFLPGSQFNALAGDDTVTLPETKSLATDLGFDVLSFSAGAGHDTVFIGPLRFKVAGNAGNDSLIGGEGNDILIGGRGDDVLEGKGGDDLLQGGVGADTLDGGADFDVVSYKSSAEGVNINLDTGTATGGDAEGDVLSDIEEIVGSAKADVLIGDDGVNVLTGGAGDDVLIGLGNEDALSGDAGIDTVDYSASAEAVEVSLNTRTGAGGDAEGDTLWDIENIIGSGHDDTLIGDAKVNVIRAGAGNDLILGGDGADILQGGSGTDTAFYRFSSVGVTVDLAIGKGLGGSATGDILTGIENITGSSYADVLRGDAGVNVLIGDTGNDILEGHGGSDTLQGDTGKDTASYKSSTDGVNVNLSTNTALGGDAKGDVLNSIENLTGSAKADVLTGNNDVNVLIGGAGDDTLAGLAKADTLRGGTGIDTADYSASAEGITIDLTASIQSGGDAEGDVLSGIENVRGSDQGDVLYGDGGVNTLIGGAGGNIFQGRAGADTIVGGTEKDTAVYIDSVTAVNVDLTAASQSGGDAEGDVLTSIESIWGSEQEGDTLRGDSGKNLIAGLGGNDILEGRGGADNLLGNDGVDTASYESSPTGVTVNLTTGINSGGDAKGDTLNTIENIIGSKFADVLTGDTNANILTGGAEADILDGGAGIDTASYKSSPGGVRINLIAGSGRDSDAQGDVLSGIENITGSDFNDVITGNIKNNVLSGGGGNDIINAGAGSLDTLIGGAGDDTLAGSTGDDVFLFDVGNDTNIVFGGTGYTDTLSLNGVEDPADWTLVLSTGSIVSQGVDFINFSPDAAGTLTYDDMTTTIDFNQIEKIIW